MARLSDSITYGNHAITGDVNVGGTLTINGVVFQQMTLTGGSNVTVSGSFPNYTISATDTTYQAGTGISLLGTAFNVDNPFNPSGNYSALRAQATTKADVGLGSADNTSDMAKPVSTAVQGALNSKANTTGTYSLRATGTTKDDVGLANVDNYSRADYDARYAAAGSGGGVESVDGMSGAVDLSSSYAGAPALLDGLRRSVEAASGGKMSVFYTAKGQPSYFVRIPKYNCEDVAPGGQLGTGVLESFLFGFSYDPEIWVGAYQATIIDGEAVSQPGIAGTRSINYDDARAACQACGPGFDIQTHWDWAAILHWCMANGFQPRGNTNHGRHHSSRHETGTMENNRTPGNQHTNTRILNGTGPASWRHDGTMSGISDLVGNCSEWMSGFKLVNGRVFLSLDNNVVDEASYTDSGYDMTFNNGTWANRPTTGASTVLKRAAILPKGVNDPLGEIYKITTGENIPYRGGSSYNTSLAGLGRLSLDLNRTGRSTGIGFRPRYRQP